MAEFPVSATTQIRLRTIWAALAIACPTYLLIARVLRPAAVPAASVLPDPARPIELVMACAAIAIVVSGFLVSRLMLRSARERLSAAPVTEDDVDRAVTQPLLVRYAMYEAASALGLALVLTGAPAAKIIPFVALSLLALGLSFPTREGIARELSG